MKWFQSAALLAALLLASGCSSTSSSSPDGKQWVLPPMAVPVQVTFQEEFQIVRLSQLLQRADLSDDARADLLQKRGNYYDNVGLRSLARLDYEQSLALNPSQPDLFNLLGVYFTESGDFDSAYDAFDSTLELDPSNTYAVRNRAVALYYGERYQLAVDDMREHFDEDPSDPFRSLWLYIVQSELEPELAREELLARYHNRDDKWSWILAGIILGEVSDQQALVAIQNGARGDNNLQAERLTEAYFYLGKRLQNEGDYARAVAMYKLAISFNVYEYVEHRYAYIELNNIIQQYREEYLAKARAEGKEVINQ
ncbi:lipoprotein NlpI [Vibrio sonorensis]|uniref:lipoprotein NlpI n=1 Tax=Vibrio sonorensis TaxID=1004316 RepID=UPI0008D903F4|nr:lipoprotein NlpI [Vibrio sonorensis]